MRDSARLLWTSGTVLSAILGCSSPTPPASTILGGQLVDKPCWPVACHANVAAARDALNRGDFAAAADAYACGDTREASFGAGLTTLITAIEGPAATAVLADVGLPPFSARDLVGATGIFSRHAARWRGTGMIEMSDGMGHVRPLTFERGQQLTGSGAYVRMRSTSSLTSLSLQFGSTPPSVGATIQLGCQGTGFAPYASLNTDDAYCSTPFVCSTDAGTITVVASGTAAGEPSEYALHGVKFECQPRAGGPATTSFLDGTLKTILAAPIDYSDLHPLFSEDEPFSAVPGATTLGRVVLDAQGLRSPLALAACYFKAASSGATGQVFEVPASLFGGAPIPVTAADGKILAATSEAGAGALQLLKAYELPMILSGMLCGGAIDCLSDEQAVERVNGGIGRLVSAEEVTQAGNQFLDAAGLGSQGFGELAPESLFTRTPDTAAALDRARDWLGWARLSLSGQNPNLPHVTPPLAIDLAAPLAHPPDPSMIPYKPLAYDMATTDVTVVDAFMRAAFPAWNKLEWTDAFWDQFDVASLPTPDRSGMLTRRLEAYGLAGD